jgi:uncharacterized protein
VADYATSIYFQDSGGVYVNLFTPSEVRWKTVRLIQDTQYPGADSVQVRVDASKAIEFALHVRMPAWLSRPALLAVNGKSLDIAGEPGSFATVRRRWSPNDTLEVKLPWRDRTQSVDDRHPGTVALMRGPLMMVAVDPPAGTPELDAPGMRFEPFYAVRGQSYTTYFRKPA